MSLRKNYSNTASNRPLKIEPFEVDIMGARIKRFCWAASRTRCSEQEVKIDLSHQRRTH